MKSVTYRRQVLYVLPTQPPSFTPCDIGEVVGGQRQ